MNMEVIVDLQQHSDISTVSVGALQNVGAWILFPKKVEFFVSEDSLKFQKVGEAVNDADPLSGEKLLKNFSTAFKPVKAGFVKVIATNFGMGPKGTMTEGKNVWLFVDEISVE